MAHIEDDTPIRLQHLRRLDLQPGDTLIVTAPGTSMMQAQQLDEWLRNNGFVPDGVKLVVFPGGTEVGVMHAGRRPGGDDSHAKAGRRLADELGVTQLDPPDPLGPEQP
jgi:hypothetical protein